LGIKGESSRIDGVLISELKQVSDDRGAVLHMLRCDSPEFVKFGECYFSEILPGAVKAWKRHSKQTQNLAVPVGRIRIVIYDERDASSTFGNLLVMELGRPDAYHRIKIPPGLWYGFACIDQIPALIANCADFPHEPGEGELASLDVSTIPYSWQNQN